MPKPVVVLVGMPGSGKTTIGRRLATALNVACVDSDVLIERRFSSLCSEVFSSLGEEKFREVEAEVIAEALTMGGVLSLGGGAVLTERTRELLLDHDVVWIDVSVEEGVRRTVNDTSRPVLAADDPEARYRMLLEQRRPLYSSVSGYRVRTDGKRPQAIVADILAHLDAVKDSQKDSVKDGHVDR